MSLRIIGAAAICLAAALPLSAHAAPPADAVYINGKVYTADAHDAVVQAFAVSGGRFVAVGSDAEIRPYVGEGTRLVLVEQGAYLDDMEQPEWREQGTNSQFDALAKLLAEA